MPEHEKFSYKSLAELKNAVQHMGLELPFSEDLGILGRSVEIGSKTVPNAIAIHPMEGCDATLSGEPDELIFRRYRRFAEGGAGLIWVEASAVANDGRANPRQLYLCNNNKESFQKLFAETMQASVKKFGPGHRPYTVIQLTHSGRYSNPDSTPKPLVAALNPYLDARFSCQPEVI